MTYPFENQVEAWKEDARMRSAGKRKSDGKVIKQAGRLKTLLQGGALSYGGVSDGDTDAGGSSHVSYHRYHRQQEVWKGRAWNSGSLLVRPGSDNPSGRVPRTTYIYLVGAAGRVRGLEVEVLVGAGKQRTILSRATGVMRACVPAREVYTVRNLSEDGKTAVLYWTSPNGKIDMAPEQAAEKDGSEEVKQEMPHALQRPLTGVEERLPTSGSTEEKSMVDRSY